MGKSAKVDMPNGGDESVSGDNIYVIREALAFEKEGSPTVQSCIWGNGYRIYPIETVPALLAKFDDVKWARLTAPAGTPIFVSAGKVGDRDERSAIVDHEATKSVLLFGVGATAARVRVRESLKDLETIWGKLKVPTTAIS